MPLFVYLPYLKPLYVVEVAMKPYPVGYISSQFQKFVWKKRRYKGAYHPLSRLHGIVLAMRISA